MATGRWTAQMIVYVNGEQRTIDAQATVASLLGELGMQSRHVAVELNLEIVPRARHAQQPLADRDRLEVVSLVGGG